MLTRISRIGNDILVYSFYVFAAVITYCGVIDREPPFELISNDSRVISADRERGTMLIEFSAIKNRYCPGFRSGWLRDAGEEPPPHAIFAINEVSIPPEGFSGKTYRRGDKMVWRLSVDVPPYLEKDFVYKAQWRFYCNPIQRFFPLFVQSPFIEVKG